MDYLKLTHLIRDKQKISLRKFVYLKFIFNEFTVNLFVIREYINNGLYIDRVTRISIIDYKTYARDNKVLKASNYYFSIHRKL